MKEYIERAAVETLVLAAALVYGREPNQYVSFLNELENIPAADVAEVRHGRWVDKTNISRSAVEQRVDCSVCGQIFWTTAVLSFNYCPNCGARMDKEDENEAD